MGKATITIKLKAKPTRKQIKAQQQVAKGKEKALKSKLKGMISQAKSQIKGLENANINSPALQKLQSKTTLSTKGKSYNELQSTYFAVQQFLKSQTATVKGATQALDRIANIIGAKNASASQIASMASEFFRIASYAQQALNVSGISVGSTRIFEVIRKVQQSNNQKWNSATDIMEKTQSVLDELQEQQAEQIQDEMALYIYDELGVSD